MTERMTREGQIGEAVDMARVATGTLPIERRWQRDARDMARMRQRTGLDRCLIAACPGAGKTLLAGRLILDNLQSRTVDLAVVVVPTRHLKMQWQDAVAPLGLSAIVDVDNATLEERRARGMELYDPERPVILVTYAQVASFPDLMAALCARHRVYAVFDEIHHADDEADYGQALLTGFESAVFKLSLSGTPFTTKGARLAFCDLRQEIQPDGSVKNRTVTDFSYSYGEALRAEGTIDDPAVVRPVAFMKWNGMARWQYTSVTTGKVTEKTFTGQRLTDPLAPLVDVDNPSFRKMLMAAVAELDGIRQHHRNAGMLIAAMDKDHAEAIERLLIEILGVDDVSVVVFDTPGAHRRIREFGRSRQRVLIAVKMVSEGVDIKRLRVGVYASNILTQMFFTQFIGRFIRWDDSLWPGQSSYVFIPEHVQLIEYAKEIEQMVEEAAMAIGTGGDGNGGGTKDPKIVTGKTGDGQFNGAIQHGLDFSKPEHEEVEAWAGDYWHRYDHAMLTDLYRRRPSDVSTTPPPSQASSTGEMAPDWGKNNEKLVGNIIARAKARGVVLAYERVQAWANKAVGIPKKDKLTPPSILKQRADHLRQLLARIIAGDVPHDLLGR